jgi:hypothetical protein
MDRFVQPPGFEGRPAIQQSGEHGELRSGAGLTCPTPERLL